MQENIKNNKKKEGKEKRSRRAYVGSRGRGGRGRSADGGLHDGDGVQIRDGFRDDRGGPDGERGDRDGGDGAPPLSALLPVLSLDF